MSEREQLEAELDSVKGSISAVEGMDLAANLFDSMGVSSAPVLEQAGRLAELYSRKAEIEQRLAGLA